MNAAARAPELTSALQWINSARLSLAELQGRIVALVFWNAGSAACHHLLAELQQLQRRHAEHLTVVAIHTPKFDAERQQALVSQAVNRLELPFPVAHDNDFVTWQHYGIDAWPSVVLLDVGGHRAATFVGDLQRDAIERALNTLIESAGFDAWRFQSRPVAARPEPALPLSFPSGIAVGPNHLYIADSGRHRVLECTPDGRVLRQFGSGLPGLVDGRSGEACLQRPRGLFLTRDALYIADAGNHALRSVRLRDGYVETLAGSGRAGVLAVGQGGRHDAVALHSPWALTGQADRVFIAMAGAGQLWELDQGDRQLRALAGTGEIGSLDGGMLDATFVQPADVVLAGRTLYIADAGGSTIRSLHLPSGHVYTLAGQGGQTFGLQDGGRGHGQLQFPCGLAVDAGVSRLWIADSYNHALRSLRLAGNELRTHALEHRLQQPTALALAGTTLWIANTGAHEILRCDTETLAVQRIPVGE